MEQCEHDATRAINFLYHHADKPDSWWQAFRRPMEGEPPQAVPEPVLADEGEGADDLERVRVIEDERPQLWVPALLLKEVRCAAVEIDCVWCVLILALPISRTSNRTTQYPLYTALVPSESVQVDAHETRLTRRSKRRSHGCVIRVCDEGEPAAATTKGAAVAAATGGTSPSTWIHTRACTRVCTHACTRACTRACASTYNLSLPRALPRAISEEGVDCVEEDAVYPSIVRAFGRQHEIKPAPNVTTKAWCARDCCLSTVLIPALLAPPLLEVVEQRVYRRCVAPAAPLYTAVFGVHCIQRAVVFEQLQYCWVAVCQNNAAASRWLWCGCTRIDHVYTHTSIHVYTHHGPIRVPRDRAQVTSFTPSLAAHSRQATCPREACHPRPGPQLDHVRQSRRALAAATATTTATATAFAIAAAATATPTAAAATAAAAAAGQRLEDVFSAAGAKVR